MSFQHLFAIACLAAGAQALISWPSAPLQLQRKGFRMRPAFAQFQVQELPVGWATGTDEATGAPFYYNEHTGQSQWEPPQQMGGEVEQNLAPGNVQLSAIHELPVGWAAGTDETTGAIFYFNEQTGQSQWEPPQQQVGFANNDGYSQPTYGTHFVWHVVSASGCFPWVDKRWTDTPRFAGRYALRNGEEAVLGRYDVSEKKPTRPWVSRMQCLVQISPDGTATLASKGKPMTGWREREGDPWYWMSDGESICLNPGNQVSLDYKDPEGTVFNCFTEAA